MELNTLHHLLCEHLALTPEQELLSESLFLQATGPHSFSLWIEQAQEVIQLSLLVTPDTLWVTQAGKRWPIPLQDTSEQTSTQTPIPSSMQPSPTTSPTTSPTKDRIAICKAAMTATLAHCELVTGQQVQSGQALYSLSAMKMQVVYYAPDAGIITAVHATNGDTLSQGQHIFDWKEAP